VPSETKVAFPVLPLPRTEINRPMADPLYQAKSSYGNNSRRQPESHASRRYYNARCKLNTEHTSTNLHSLIPTAKTVLMFHSEFLGP
jgi:hypothetical protein